MKKIPAILLSLCLLLVILNFILFGINPGSLLGLGVSLQLLASSTPSSADRFDTLKSYGALLSGVLFIFFNICFFLFFLLSDK